MGTASLDTHKSIFALLYHNYNWIINQKQNLIESYTKEFYYHYIYTSRVLSLLKSPSLVSV
jgi:hypothetical protein